MKKLSIKLEGRYKLECRDKEGRLLWKTGWRKNTTTNAGFAAVAGLVGNTGTITAFTYLALGTSATAATAAQTALVAEITDTGLARTTTNISRVTTTQTNDTLQLAYTWTATGTKTIQEIGVFNASSLGIMLCRQVVSGGAVANTNQVSATYQIKFS